MTSSTFTVHVKELVEDLVTLYLAPEVLRDASARTEGVDVFSLSCIAFLLFANKPPAEDPLQLRGKRPVEPPRRRRPTNNGGGAVRRSRQRRAQPSRVGA